MKRIIYDSVGDYPENMRPRQAASYLGTSKAFLDQSRVHGTGPKFVRVSRSMVLYRRTDLDDFLEARLFVSTAEADAAEQAGGVK
jgi:hypothetical protein